MTGALLPIPNAGVQTVVVYSGPRGRRGAAGFSFEMLGSWAADVQYLPNQAVVARSTGDAAETSMFVARLGQSPTLGVEPYLEPLAWSEVGSAAIAASVGPALPLSPRLGELWYLTTPPVGLYIYLEDEGGDRYWVQANNGAAPTRVSATRAELVAGTPDPATSQQTLIHVTDASPRNRLAYSDGSDWRYASNDVVVT